MKPGIQNGTIITVEVCNIHYSPNNGKYINFVYDFRVTIN